MGGILEATASSSVSELEQRIDRIRTANMWAGPGNRYSTLYFLETKQQTSDRGEHIQSLG